MKDLNLIVWLTQLGISVAAPLAGFTLLAFWLRQRFDLGNWVLLVGICFGVISAIDGFRVSLKAMDRMNQSKKKDSENITVSFNEHD